MLILSMAGHRLEGDATTHRLEGDATLPIHLR